MKMYLAVVNNYLIRNNYKTVNVARHQQNVNVLSMAKRKFKAQWRIGITKVWNDNKPVHFFFHILKLAFRYNKHFAEIICWFLYESDIDSWSVNRFLTNVSILYPWKYHRINLLKILFSHFFAVPQKVLWRI